MRLVFMGTPEFAIPSLKALIGGHEVVGVFCQPDKPVGRHQNKLEPPIVKRCTLNYNTIGYNIPVYQPETLRDGAALAILKELDPELIVVAAYGRFLPDEILNLPPRGCINVHSSLLPKYRGSAPINWAILNGERVTGVTIQRMVRDMDAGDIILQRSTPIGETEDAAALYDRLARLGGELAVEAVAQIQAGTATYTPQDHTRATQAPMLSKAMSPVDWTRSAQEIFNQIRGLYPWPGASTTALTGEPIKLWGAQVVEKHTDATPGTVIAAGKQGIDVACGDFMTLRILELQAPGKKRMSAAAYLAGHPIQV